MPKDSSASRRGAGEQGRARGGCGVVALQRRRGRPEVAVIHRPRYDDWSLPKGKVDPGENEPVTAVREVHEETGYGSHLGRRLLSVSYPVERRASRKCGTGRHAASMATSRRTPKSTR